jgi:phosphoglycerate dehydrogenase-like enzyme
MPLLNIYCNFNFPESAARIFRDGISGYNLLMAPKPQKPYAFDAAPDPLLAEADIAVGQPPSAGIIACRRLRWVHLTSAGYDRYDRPAVRSALEARGIILTSSSAVFDEPCAQHLLAFMLAQARQLPPALELRHGDHSWPGHALRVNSRLLNGQSVLLVGFGAIARRLVELLAPLQMNVSALRRTVRGDEPVTTFPSNQADEQLPLADHVVNVLPGGLETERFFNARRLGLMKPSAIFYNVGRGTTVDQAALQAALESGRPAAAYLDVTTPEPLPPDHPLWTTPRCYITPHTAGGFDGQYDRQAQHFINNLRRFEQGQPLLNRVI